MKRFLASLLAASMLFGTFVTASAAVDTSDAALVKVDENFKTYTNGEDIISKASDYEWAMTGGITSFDALDDSGNMVAEFNTIGQTTDGSVTLKFATGTTAVTGDVSVEFDYKVNSSYAKGVQFNVQPSSGHGVCVDIGINSISYHNGSSTQTAFSSLPKNKWYHLELVLHTSASTFDMYLTDENGNTQDAKGLSTRASISGGVIKIFMAGKKGDASVLFDNFLVGPYVESQTGGGDEEEDDEEIDENIPYTAPSALEDGDYVIFAGDSITASGGYPNYIQDFYATRYPDKRIYYYNAAIGGDTAEDILARYDYDIKPHIGKANKIYIMLGTNDVKVFLYVPSNEGNSSKDAEKANRIDWAESKMEDLLKKVTTDFPDAEVTVMLDSAIDTVSDWASEGVSGATEFSSDVNDGLRKLGTRYKKLCQTYNANYVDMNQYVLDAVNKQKELDVDSSEWIVNKDRIHPNNKGQMVMAYALLKGEYKIDDDISNVWIDAAELSYTPENCEIDNVTGDKTGVSYTYTPYSLPMYATGDYTVADKLVNWTDNLNREIIQVEGLEDGTYTVKLKGKTAMSASNTELAAGVNIGALLSNPNQSVSLSIYNKSKAKRDKEMLVRHLMRVKMQMIEDGVDITNKDEVIEALNGYDPATSIGVSAQYALEYIKDFDNPMASVYEIIDEIEVLEGELYDLCVPVSYNVEITKTAGPVPGLLYEEKFEGMSNVTGWDAYTLTSDSNRVSLTDSNDGSISLKTDSDAKKNKVLSISDISSTKAVRADTTFDTRGVKNIRIELDVLPTDFSAITLTDDSSGNFTATSNNYFMYMCFINGNIQYRDTGSAVETTGKGWYNVGEWNKVVIELDTVTPKYTISINQKEVVTRNSLKWGTNKVPSTLCVGSVYSLAKTSETLVDNIRIYDASYDEFSITESGIYKGEEKLENPPVKGDVIKASATFRNISGYKKDVKVVLVQYNEDGAITNVAIKDVELSDDNNLQTVTTDTFTAEEKSDFKVFIWTDELSPV